MPLLPLLRQSTVMVRLKRKPLCEVDQTPELLCKRKQENPQVTSKQELVNAKNPNSWTNKGDLVADMMAPRHH